MSFDPFGDFETRGYLRNNAGEKDPDRVKALEHEAFRSALPAAFAALQNRPQIAYQDVLDTHRRLFASVYPWAGHDRLVLAPDLAIGKAGQFDLFAHPQDIRRAVEFGLAMAADPAAMRAQPGEIMGYLAYGHPFLEGNGRTLLTAHVDLARRAGFAIDWLAISKDEYLAALTTELRRPGTGLDDLLRPHLRAAPTDAAGLVAALGDNPGLGPPPRDRIARILDAARPAATPAAPGEESVSDRLAAFERRRAAQPSQPDAANPGKTDAEPEEGPKTGPSSGPKP